MPSGGSKRHPTDYPLNFNLGWLAENVLCWNGPFPSLNLTLAAFVNLTDLSIQLFCQMDKAWWPLASLINQKRQQHRP